MGIIPGTTVQVPSHRPFNFIFFDFSDFNRLQKMMISLFVTLTLINTLSHDLDVKTLQRKHRFKRNGPKTTVLTSNSASDLKRDMGHTCHITHPHPSPHTRRSIQSFQPPVTPDKATGKKKKVVDEKDLAVAPL